MTDDLVAFLSSPDAYEDRPEMVEVRETHMSWVFLTGEFVYKLKKPIRTSYLDFSTLAARERNCREEVRLNRRLAADVYLGIVAIARDASGALTLDGEGETVDWLVKMRRLPEDRMLDTAIGSGSVTADAIDDVATVLAGFFTTAEPAGISVAAYLARLEHQLHLDRAILCDRRFDLPRGLAERVLDRLMNAVTSGDGQIEGALQADRLVEGHGDLRPEHVCLLDPPVIIDCLEFNRDLRLVDPFDDIAYLALECRFIGAPWIGERLLARISDGLGVRPSEALIAFYTSFRACLRARLSLAHLLDPVPRTPEKWLPQAIAYLEIADRESAKLPPPEAR
jgi:aminoglycoside phosphotransferase family enzyme